MKPRDRSRNDAAYPDKIERPRILRIEQLLVMTMQVLKMDLDMQYSANITAGSLKLRESRIVADLLLNEIKGEEWRKAIGGSNHNRIIYNFHRLKIPCIKNGGVEKTRCLDVPKWINGKKKPTIRMKPADHHFALYQKSVEL